MRALYLAPESPYPSHSGGAMRAASAFEWLAKRAEVSALVCSPPAPRVDELCAHLEVVEMPRHSRAAIARLVGDLSRAVRALPPLVDRVCCSDLEASNHRMFVHRP